MRRLGTLTLPGGKPPGNGKGRFCGAAPSKMIADVADRLNFDSEQAASLQCFANGANAAVRSWRAAPKVHEQNALAAEVERWAYLKARPNPLRESW